MINLYILSCSSRNPISGSQAIQVQFKEGRRERERREREREKREKREERERERRGIPRAAQAALRPLEYEKDEPEDCMENSAGRLCLWEKHSKKTNSAIASLVHRSKYLHRVEFGMLEFSLESLITVEFRDLSRIINA